MNTLISKKYLIGLVFVLWVGGNLVAFYQINSQHQREISELGLNTDLVAEFQSVSQPVILNDNSSSYTLESQLFIPENRTDSTRFPLVVILHGAGDRGTDNIKQLRHLPMRLATSKWQAEHPCFVLCPQCPPAFNWSSPCKLHDTPESETDSNLVDIVKHSIDELCNEYPVDRNKIYLTGHSMGGYGCWEMLKRYPDLFAASAPLSGGGDENAADIIKSTPLWVVHGDEDEVVPVSESRKMVQALRELDANVTYKELKGVKHDCWTFAYTQNNELLEWMFSQQK